jgi:hypothetical protein
MLLGESAEKHWYYKSKLAMLRAYCRNVPREKLLDVGAGSGFFARALLADPATRSAVCVDPNYSDENDETVFGKPLRFRRHASSADADLYLFMDVLEHVENDVGLLNDYVDRASSGSHFLISVPAFQFLWSEHDVFLEHYRRYSRRELCRLVEDAHLTLVDSSYFYGLVFPLAVATRLAGRVLSRSHGPPRSQLRAHHPAVNGLLAGICWFELPLARLNKIAGLSVFCLARKDG